MGRELTTDEVREKFLKYVWTLIDYWESIDNPHDDSVRGRISGMAFSLLSAIDGSAGAFPGFVLTPSPPGFNLAPCPHPDDKEYRQNEGEDWFPENNREINCDIGGCLHELFDNYDPKKNTNKPNVKKPKLGIQDSPRILDLGDEDA